MIHRSPVAYKPSSSSCDGLQEINESGFAELFERAENAIKLVEHRHSDLIVPAVNELRYACYHIVNYIKDPTQSDEIKKACGHCKRSTYDAYEAGILYCCREYEDFQNDYKNCVITNVLPDYIEKRKSINDGLEFTRSIDKETKAQNYEQCEKHHKELVAIVDSLREAREELNKTISKDRKRTQILYVGIFLGVVGIFATIVFGVVPLFKTNNNENIQKPGLEDKIRTSKRPGSKSQWFENPQNRP